MKGKSYIWWLVSLIVLAGVIYKVKPYYTPAQKQQQLNVRNHNDDTLRIAYIGDSWADGHKKHNCIIDSIISKTIGKIAKVRTAGVSGLTSKNIYYGIFRNDSIRDVIEWGPDYCFVVAGINDSDRKMGKGYYKENMRLIIESMLENQITPVILDIPSFDIEFSFKRRTRLIKLQYLASMVLTYSKMDCIDDYRNAYHDLIVKQNWNNRVITISTNDWNPEGYNDKRGLYDEGLMHLNAKGYHVLDSCIAKKIINHFRASSNSEYH